MLIASYTLNMQENETHSSACFSDDYVPYVELREQSTEQVGDGRSSTLPLSRCQCSGAANGRSPCLVRDGQGEFQSSERGGGLEVVSLLLGLDGRVSLVQCFVSLLLGLVRTCMFIDAD
jgi:hypothetical protein